MKKILFLAVALLGAVCVEIYSSRQELKFDGGVPTYPVPARGEQTVSPGERCDWIYGNRDGKCKVGMIGNCAEIVVGDHCEGVTITPPEVPIE